MLGKVKITLTNGEFYEVKTTLADGCKWDRARTHYNWAEVNLQTLTGPISLMTSYVAYASMVRLKHFTGRYEEFEELLDSVEIINTQEDAETVIPL